MLESFQQRLLTRRSVLTFALSLVMGLTASAQGRQLSPALRPYLSCRSVAGAMLTETTPLIAAPSKRSVQTLQGDRQIDVADGVRLNYKRNGVDYAYMRVEELPFATYPQGRVDLISNFKRLISGDELLFPEEALPPSVAGFQIMGSNHHVMLGDALGLYLLLDARTHVVVTIYFQNSDMAHHSFSNMVEYAKLRDEFLIGYLTCVRSAPQQP